jgi:ADP-ribose pyrophosphatase YjhB (NUDIX family)
MEHYYLERDGQVFLIADSGRLRFPISRSEIPFTFEVMHTMQLQGARVHYCKPHLEIHPEDWWHKEKIPSLDAAMPIVRLAVNTSLPRLTAKAIILKGGKILMVKPKRGYNAGQWALPGGFVGYGETPEEAARRETIEETGVPCRIVGFLGTESRLGRTTSYHWHTFFYEAQLDHERFCPAPDEIETVAWIELDQALSFVSFYEGLRDKLRQVSSAAEKIQKSL